MESRRAILRSVLTASSPIKRNLAETIHRRFAGIGGIELPTVRRDALRAIPGFEE
jgi:antitoxin FitA